MDPVVKIRIQPSVSRRLNQVRLHHPNSSPPAFVYFIPKENQFHQINAFEMNIRGMNYC